MENSTVLERMMLARTRKEPQVVKKSVVGRGRKKEVKSLNIGDVRKMWKDREKAENAGMDTRLRMTGLGQGRQAPVAVDEVDDEVVVDNDVENDVEIDRTKADVVSVTRQKTDNYVDIDSVVRGEPDLSKIDNIKTYTDLSRKRKVPPVSVQDTPGKRGRAAPLLGLNKDGSHGSHKLNSLITHHFTFTSLASSRGGDQAVHTAVGDTGGGGGIAGAVQGTCAITQSGLAGEGVGGPTRHIVTGSTIGPDQTADRTAANPGGSTVQLIVRKIQRGNAHNSKM